MEIVRFVCCAVLLIVGLFIQFSAALGIWRLPSALPRMHSVAMGDSLGKLCLVAGLLLCPYDGFGKLKLLFILVFFWLSGPVSSHLLCRFQVEEEQKDTEG